jgi:hypothetical protein
MHRDLVFITVIRTTVRDPIFLSSSHKTHSSVGIVTGWTAEDSRFDSRQKKSVFLSSTASRPALGPTQSYAMDTCGSIPGVKRLGHEADHAPLSSAEVNT